jgi:hypothetical protein
LQRGCRKLTSRDVVFLVIGAAVAATIMLTAGLPSATSFGPRGAEDTPVLENKQNDPSHPAAGPTGDSAFGPGSISNSQVDENNDDDPANFRLFFFILLWLPRLLVVNEEPTKPKVFCGPALARPG